MGMGNYADGADTVSIDFVKEICPEEMANFQAALDETEACFDDFCEAEQLGEEIRFIDEQDGVKIQEAYRLLKDKFNKETGLTLYVAYHDADDRGDELDGGTFTVEDVYMRTPAGEKYKDQIVKMTWTNFG
jgi:hypothetical protein